MTLNELGKVIKNTYSENVVNAKKVATGRLRDSEYSVEIDKGHYIVYLDLPEYWEVIENGGHWTKFPPKDKIMDWIKVKRLVPEARKGKVPTTELMAYLISRKIYNDGLKPFNLLDKTLKDEAVNTAIDEFVDNLISNIFEIIKADLNGAQSSPTLLYIE